MTMTQGATPSAASRLDVGPASSTEEVVAAVRAWVEEHVPAPWVEAGRKGGAAQVRTVRRRARTTRRGIRSSGRLGSWSQPGRSSTAGWTCRATWRAEWTRSCGPTTWDGSTRSGSTWPRRRSSLTGPRSSGCVSCRRSSAMRKCGASSSASRASGSDLASLSTRAERDGDEWLITGQKVWTTWAHLSSHAVLLARTDPDVPKRAGITYFLIELDQPGVEVRPLRHIGGEVDFNEVFLDGARVPGSYRVGQVGEGWKVANATLSGERQMVSGSGSGGVDRIGGSGADALVRLARRVSAEGRPGGWDDPVRRDAVVQLWAEERVREWTNQRVRAQMRAGRSPGPESSIGKVHQGGLNQRIQELAVDLLGAGAMAWRDVGGAGLGPGQGRVGGGEGDPGGPGVLGGLGGLGGPERWAASPALRSAGDAAQPGQHDRRGHDRGEQEHPRGTRARPPP